MTMLEKIARAWDREDAAMKGEPSPWDSPGAADDAEWVSERLSCARAALLAMRDAGVTEAMWRAAYDEGGDQYLPSAGFPAMIDAILAEGAGG